MESESKRRKLDHGSSGLRHAGLINFESPSSAQISTASTFVLQTEELLKEAKLDYGRHLKDADAQLFQLKTIVDSIGPHDPIPIAEATAQLEKNHRIIVPYPEPRPPKDSAYKVSYSKPSQCNVVGSYVSRTMVKNQPSVSIDMVAQMPSSLFQDKDYLSLRYFYRRAYYVAYVAAHVRKAIGEAMTFCFEFLHENPLLPVLVLRRPLIQGDGNGGAGGTVDKPPKHSAKENCFSIRLIPCAPDNLFPWSKLTPAANCTRINDNNEKKGEKKGELMAASPIYNSTLNAERTFIQYLRVLTHAKNECAAFLDACVLGRIWLQQRGFGSAISRGGFGHFEWAVMIALLLQMGGRNGQSALSSSLSSAELFKAGIQFLSTTDFVTKPYAFAATGLDMKTVREPGPVMFDPVRQLNVLYKMSPWSAALLQMYAKSTSDLLSDDAADKFQPTFIMKTDVAFQLFDAVLEINKLDLAKYSAYPDRSTVGWKFGWQVHKVLKKAFGDRAEMIHVQLPALDEWPLSSPSSKPSAKLVVGFVFNPANMSRQMEHGPPAEEEKAAAAFRQFWGEKAELRRFKDGSILECVEWSSRLPSQICQEIAVHALQRHLQVAQDEVARLGSGFSSLIGLSHVDREAFDSSRRAFTAFENDIRSLDQLPLQIRQLSPVSPSARYASLEPPSVAFHRDTVEPMDVNLYFEASNKWPENLIAVQEAKVDFLLDFGRRLTSANDKIVTHLGRENRDMGPENLAYLDVVYESGAAFRLRIYSDVEEKLLQHQVQNKTLDAHVRDDAARALASLSWQYSTLPLHSQTIATFCTRFQPLSPSIRLAKHWFRSHKLHGLFSDELIELIVLHVFLQPYPWKMPSSPMTGLLRTLLFLSRWDWREEPLIVDSAETVTGEERWAMRRGLQAWRKRDPHMNTLVMFVATSHHHSGMAYTQTGPSKLIASRMTRLAQAACKLLRGRGLHLQPASLFESSLQDYDVLIHLSPKVLGGVVRESAADSSAKKHSQYKNLDHRTGKMPLAIRSHPSAVLLHELQRVYQDSVVFFSGGPRDPVLAAVWNPKLQQEQKFRAGLPYNFCRVAATNTDVVEMNQRAILLEIARIGGDMIRKIEVVDA
ncbi:uncharacterized protein UV8b_01425 [Ustilaginoidea virens]|uniref:U3 small nucleolar RNA-associated protein 22 n=1 Tax=Ustilaginoidea virens TaxID=1159556 RepID=A0A8E5HKQ5_USTVR|nr:uncharacterized protein UV8b_01425 [Ustilaginoidea virens]QUC17184.1 hypothetical protein UV8b_01425 [Ustilaginoidea virens]